MPALSANVSDEHFVIDCARALSASSHSIKSVLLLAFACVFDAQRDVFSVLRGIHLISKLAPLGV